MWIEVLKTWCGIEGMFIGGETREVDDDVLEKIGNKKLGDKICILPDRVSTSDRRWKADGILYTSIKNLALLALYYLGVSPDKLAKHYRRHSEY